MLLSTKTHCVGMGERPTMLLSTKTHWVGMGERPTMFPSIKTHRVGMDEKEEEMPTPEHNILKGQDGSPCPLPALEEESLFHTASLCLKYFQVEKMRLESSCTFLMSASLPPDAQPCCSA